MRPVLTLLVGGGLLALVSGGDPTVFADAMTSGNYDGGWSAPVLSSLADICGMATGTGFSRAARRVSTAFYADGGVRIVDARWAVATVGALLVVILTRMGLALIAGLFGSLAHAWRGRPDEAGQKHGFGGPLGLIGIPFGVVIGIIHGALMIVFTVLGGVADGAQGTLAGVQRSCSNCGAKWYGGMSCPHCLR